MSAFDAAWLALREPHDLRARDAGLADRFAAAVAAGSSRPVRILDLASGTGASLRALAPVIGVDQHWTLVDHDDGLVRRQAVEIARWAAGRRWAVDAAQGQPAADPAFVVLATTSRGTARWTVACHRLDLAHGLEALDPAAYDGVTTSAFLDLVSSAWLERFARVLHSAARPLLAVLSADGIRTWDPALPGDATVLAAFERHQSRDKGFGPALGAAAPHRLAELLVDAGHGVMLAPSPWRIGPDDPAMLRPLLDDTLRAAAEADPDRAERFRSWAAERTRLLDAGRMSLTVGHVDLFALPPARTPPSLP